MGKTADDRGVGGRSVGPLIFVHGSDAQKQRYLPLIASGELRLQAFGVTEPTSGTDTLSLRTTAKREGNDHYVINGQKIWTSRAEHSDLMLLLARTASKEQAKKRTDGLSVFLVDMRLAQGASIAINPIRTMKAGLENWIVRLDVDPKV